MLNQLFDDKMNFSDINFIRFKSEFEDYHFFFKLLKVAQIRVVPRQTRLKIGLYNNDMSDQYAHTASHMRKSDLQQNDHNISLKLQNLPDDEAYHQRVQHQHPIRNSQYHLRSAQNLQTEYNYESISKIHPLDHSQQKEKRSEYFSQSSSVQRRSYKSTTHEQIMSKYDIKQIMKREHEKQEKKWKNWKLAGKILLIFLLFPFSLIYLLITYINKKHAQKQKNKPQYRKQQKNSKNSKQQIQRRQRRQKSTITKCCDKFQICCQDYFCYYLCCQCCDECNCCTRFCRKLQKCSQCLCQNAIVEGIQDFFSRCFVKNCEKCCRFICCHKRTHEKLDTIQRLQRMSQKSQDRINLY